MTGLHEGVTGRTGALPRPVVVAGVAGGLVGGALLGHLFLGTGLLASAILGLCLALLLVVAASARREGRRRAVDRLATGLLLGCAGLSLLPLVSVLYFTASKGLHRFGGYFLTHSMRGVGPLDPTGGAYHAVLGTLEQVGIATVLAVPLGLLAAVYTVEYGRGRLATTVRFLTDVMTGVPSIVAGLFIYAAWVLALHRGFSGLAAALALTILMLPTIVRATEEMLKLVPGALREAAYALGVPRWRAILSVVLPTASAGIITGVMLAVARVAGETAPLLLTALNFDSINTNPFAGQQAALPTFVFAQAQAPQTVSLDRAWAGAMTLVLVILVLNVVARAIARRSRVAS